MLIKLNDKTYINPDMISAVKVGTRNEIFKLIIGNVDYTNSFLGPGARDEWHEDDVLCVIQLTDGSNFRFLADEVFPILQDAGVIASRGAEAITLTDAEYVELQELREQGFRYIAQDNDGKIYAYVERPVKNAAYWEEGGDYERLDELYANLPDLDKTPLSITALLQEVARE